MCPPPAHRIPYTSCHNTNCVCCYTGTRYSLIILRLYNNAVDDLVINTISQRCVVLEELYLQDSPAAPKARETEKLVWEVVLQVVQ